MQREQMPVEAFVRGGEGRAALVADDADPPVSRREQVLGGLPGRGHVVDADVVGADLVLLLAEQDQGDGAGAGGQPGLVEPQRAEHHTVDQRVAQAAGHGEFGLRVPARLLDQHGAAPALGRPDQLRGERREVRREQFRHGEREHPAAARAQLAGSAVRAVSQLLHGQLHPPAGGFRDMRLAAHHVGDGFDGDARQLRDVLQPHSGHGASSVSAGWGPGGSDRRL